MVNREVIFTALANINQKRHHKNSSPDDTTATRHAQNAASGKKDQYHANNRPDSEADDRNPAVTHATAEESRNVKPQPKHGLPENAVRVKRIAVRELESSNRQEHSKKRSEHADREGNNDGTR